MEWEKAAEVMNRILPGETVLVEYTTSYIPEFLLRFFVDYSKRTGTALLIDDNFDTLHTIITHAEFMNLTIDLRDVYVQKTGGRIELGKVVAKVPFHSDPRIYLKNYEETSQRVFKEVPSPTINLVLGLENIFLIVRNPFDVYRILLAIQRFTGNKRRKAFYIVNRKVMESLPVNVLPELERISTTLIELSPYHTGANLRVKKSVNLSLAGKEVNIDARGWE
ncbi:hypothetical protein A3L11_04670 [Thermococcus siculi]|uniref:KaiC-like domain-containing protein n=1 Tax=Thermococcus siculi TaxID=72803 RepID=A0A2Z2MJE5_9EURY|nr:DUF257 family protein [Thermococcus siculi]ASJ08562.1 hypothetical protein A3L11_04670 [Thermococcus siculi]